MRTGRFRAAVVAAATALLAVTGATAASAAPAEVVQDTVFQPATDTPVTALVTKLTHAQATARFSAAGISWTSSGGCSDRNNPTCTSFTQINLTTVQGAETLKRATGCALTITGGTETGHASGTYSHWNGYKLDFRLTTCLTNYVKGTFTSIGGNKWQSGSGNVYYLESNHWDVTYYNCGGC
ncbi:hypothetical protein [Saccharothrix texasensis]|uniref:Peptidase M15-like protein n=1 Tax=Saccharothrix texasensis TaxID=103734 RepID=A0A3N1HGN7_9PSEU|nr:hypothetical protein [Saccharothrix texasensis]ROP41640.1 hypothetical protein EDD40_7076 [Saccharothrix texasensis]